MKQENNKNQEYSQENNNLEIIRKGEVKNEVLEIPKTEDNKSTEKNRNIFIGTLNVFSQPIKKRHEKHYKESTFHLLADIFGILIIFVLIISLVYLRLWQPKENIILEIKQINDIIYSGQVEIFELNFQNKEKEKIVDCAISVNLPENFKLIQATPENLFDENTNTFKLSDTHTNANGKIKISGQVFGEVGSQQKITFTYSYKINNKYKNISSTLVYNIEDSVLLLNLDMPNKMYKDMNYQGKIYLKNKSQEDLSGIEIVFPNEEWLLVNGSEDIKDNGIIIIEKLTSQEEKEIDFTVKNSSEAGEKEFCLDRNLQINNESLNQGSLCQNVEVRVPDFEILLTPKEKAINDNDEINYNLFFNNKESKSISNVKILFFTDDSFSINGLRTNNYNINMGNNNILIFKDSIDANQSDSFDLSLTFKRLKKEINQSFPLKARVSYEIEGENVEYYYSVPPIKILSNLDIDSGGYYYSIYGDQLGTGPLNPTVDFLTNYWIIWNINNFGNNLKNIEINADLGDSAIWVDNKSLLAGNLSFNEETGKILWNINEIKEKEEGIKASFQIGVIPQKSQIGDIITLIKNIKYKAYDAFCEQEISGVLGNIDTNIISDKLGANNGVVKEKIDG